MIPSLGRVLGAGTVVAVILYGGFARMDMHGHGVSTATSRPITAMAAGRQRSGTHVVPAPSTRLTPTAHTPAAHIRPTHAPAMPTAPARSTPAADVPAADARPAPTTHASAAPARGGRLAARRESTVQGGRRGIRGARSTLPAATPTPGTRARSGGQASGGPRRAALPALSRRARDPRLPPARIEAHARSSAGSRARSAAATRSAVVTVSIPRLGVEATAYDRGLDARGNMPIAPGYALTHYRFSARAGQRGNVVLYGHDDIEGSIFRALPSMRIGDPVYITDGGHRYTYRVTGSQVVDPSDVAVLKPTLTPTLTLLSCTPYEVDTRRIVVRAVLAA